MEAVTSSSHLIFGTMNNQNESYSSHKPPFFNGENYPYWKHRMEMYLESIDYEVWQIVRNGLTPPTKIVNGATVLKEEHEFTAEDKLRFTLNSKARYNIVCAVSAKEYENIASCNTAKEMWDILAAIHEGTSYVKESHKEPIICYECKKTDSEELVEDDNLNFIEIEESSGVYVRASMIDLEKKIDDQAALIAAEKEETVAPPEGNIPKNTESVLEHEVNQAYNLLSYAYCLGKGKCDSRNLNVNGIKATKTLFGNTALHIAARYGINEVVEKIAECDKEEWFNSKNSNEDIATHVAARAGQISTLQTLLAVYVQYLHDEKTAEEPIRRSVISIILTKPNKQGNTIFHEALISGGQKGAAIFEALASPITIKDKEDGQPFYLSDDYVYGHEVSLTVNKDGKSPLYLAIEFGYKRLVEQLLEKCQDHIPTGKSPLLPAIVKRDLDMLDIILHHKAEWIHLQDDQEWLPLHYAAYFGYLDGVCSILKICPSCTLMETKYGLYPLHLASYEGHVEVFKKLLCYCLDPYEMLNRKGQNVLHIAAENGKHNVVSYILQVPELQNLINEKDEEGNTPLHLAARFFRAKVVHTLTWDKRVDLTMVNARKQTALDVAADAMKENPTLRERQTWSALRSAKTPRRHPQSRVNKVESSNEVPSESKEASLKGKYQEQGANTELFKDRIDTLIVVSTLIVTVTFAAGIQFPGGSSGSGQANLLNKGMFQLYIISITISMYGALIATIILFMARLGDITLLNLALKFAMPLLGITLTTLSAAFLAAVYLVICKLTWLATIFLLISVIFVFMVVSIYILLWLPSPSTIPIVRNMSYYPFLLLAWLDEDAKVTPIT